YTIHKLHLCGLLHSQIHGSMPTYGSPWLFAVSRVLLRLPVPRHSPCALCSLTMFKSGFSVKNLFTEIAFFEIVDFHLNNILFSLYLLLFIQFSMCCDP